MSQSNNSLTLPGLSFTPQGFSFRGFLTHDIVHQLASLTVQHCQHEIHSGYAVRLYHVTNEMLQNAHKHAVCPLFLALSQQQQLYQCSLNTQTHLIILSTTNPIGAPNALLLKKHIDYINHCNARSKSLLFQHTLANIPITPEGNAGLGLIDIGRKSSAPLHYTLTPLDPETYLFTLTVTLYLLKKKDTIRFS